MGHAVVTGASRGIGRALAESLADDGWVVTAVARSADRTGPQRSGAIRPRALDVADPAALRHAAEDLAGPDGRIDLLVCGAAIWDAESASGSAVGPLESVDADAVAEVLRVNAVGTLATVGALLPWVRRAPAPVVAVLSSGLGSLARAVPKAAWGYQMSKAAVNMLVRQLAAQLEPPALAVSLDPGWVRTGLGGDDASLTVDDAVAGLRWALANLGGEHHGAFVNRRLEPVEW